MSASALAAASAALASPPWLLPPQKKKIEYLHLPRLGTPAALRRQVKAGGMLLHEYLNRFREYALGQNRPLDDLLALVQHHRSCLLCVERSPSECHRSVIVELLQHC